LPKIEMHYYPYSKYFNNYGMNSILLTSDPSQCIIFIHFHFSSVYKGYILSNSILIIDDNAKLCKSLTQNLVQFGYKCFTANTQQTAVNTYKRNNINVVLLDVVLGKDDGLKVLRLLKKINSRIPVIMITGYASIESAVQSIKLGAYDYIQKPLDFNKLLKILENAIRLSELKEENINLKERLIEQSPKIITQNSQMIELCEKAEKLAATDIPVLICGENGTGKEIIADFIHVNSERNSRKMLKINCAAFPENLLDNELFGHEKGSYTGAESVFKGVFERAHSGSLFLDEIGDMSLPIQAKILRVLQNKEIRRIGGDSVIQVDVRFIAASNKILEELIVDNTFRKDLFYRLNAATLYIPALRERKDDIPPLANHFLTEFTDNNRHEIEGFSNDVMAAFISYEWPGNVRQLKNTIFYAAAISTKHYIGGEDLPAPFSENNRNATENNLRETTERHLIQRVLQSTQYNKKKTAEILKVARKTLYNKIEKYGIEIP